MLDTKVRWVLVFLVLLGGCRAPLGYLANLLGPPPTREAQFEPDDVPTLVFVDDVVAETADVSLRRRLSLALEKQLSDRGVLEQVLGHEQIEAVRRDSGADFNRFSIEEVGAACRSRQVVYVEISQYRLQSAGGSSIYSGLLRLQVKLVGVDTGQRLWPTASSGHPIKVDIPPTEGQERDFPEKLSERMVVQAADQVAKLFYEHQI